MPKNAVACKPFDGQPYSANKELRSRDRFEGDPIPQPLNPPRELVDEMGSPMVVKVIGGRERNVQNFRYGP
jgi:hypothetical protein